MIPSSVQFTWSSRLPRSPLLVAGFAGGQRAAEGESRGAPRDAGSTCLAHNPSKSTNFLAIEVVPNAARGDLSVGATNTFPLRDFDMELSRESRTSPATGGTTLVNSKIQPERRDSPQGP